MAIEDDDGLDRVTAALTLIGERMGPRTPLRLVRLLIFMALDDAPFGTASDFAIELGVPDRTTAADLLRLSEVDRHGEPGLGFVTTIPRRSINRTLYVVNQTGRQFLADIARLL